MAKLEWFALVTGKDQENTARFHLGKEGLRVLLPVEHDHVVPAMRRKHSIPVHNLLPLFPGYIFVRCNWKRDKGIVQACKGIHSFVGYRDGMKSALPIHKTNMKSLMDRLVDYKGWDVLGRPLTAIEEGVLVQALTGMFRYMPAPAHLISGNRIELAYPILGKTVTQVFHIDDLQEARPV